ncbi:hypothetical protein [Paracoccus aestuariivivens]|uniref:RcnB family protein n=1 Tax=Paracoccus aestuariivivens TaxID=1820333 RepID=A0A6L6J4K5_9RHOB|nr:hypothetical protein [Paracoccus aestuariivivens]MTH76810.1 hypothetical protein [Paracoccus aestuariivivens]
MPIRRIIGSAFLIFTIAATAVQADPRHGRHGDHDHKHDYRHDDWRDHRDSRDYRERYAREQRKFRCPQGLVAVKGECLRPGHARRDRQLRVGERFQANNYRRVTNPGLYNLQQYSGSQYYSDNNSIYQVDSKTQKIMAVMSLMQMMQGMR